MKDCIYWPATQDRDGYGTLYRKGLSGSTGAHRLIFEANVGPIPEGFCVLHKCDNPSCINPEHLFLGTVGDNNRDCVAKGRHVALHGADHPRHKLTEKDVQEILNLKGVRPQSELAEMYGINQSTVSRIQSGEKWPHLQPREEALYAK